MAALHVIHPKLPPSDHVPALQSKHPDDALRPDRLDQVPALQLTHTEEETADAVEDHVPLAQLTHAVERCIDQDPIGHAEQLDAKLAAIIVEKVPALQLRQDVAPTKDDQVPALHCEQLIAAADDQVPALQLIQLVEDVPP